MTRPEAKRPHAALTAVGLAALGLATLMAIPWPTARHDCPPALVEILERSEPGAALTDDDVRTIRALGTAGAEALFRVGARGSLVPGGTALDARRWALVDRCAAALEPAAVRRVVGAHMNTITTASDATSLLRLIEGAGRGEDVERAIRIGARQAAGAPQVVRAMTDAIAAVLARDHEAFDRLAPAFERAPPSLHDAIVDAAARSGSPHALTFLEHVLVWEPTLRIAALSDIGRIAARCCAPVGEHARESLVSILDDATGSRHALREACMTAGRVQVHAAVPALVDLLAHADGPVRSASHWALRRITGLDFPRDAERWLLWLRDETSWHRDARTRVAAALASDDLATVTGALGEAAEHRYRRDAIAADVARALEHPSRIVRLRACAVLGQLGGRSVPAHVVHLLDDDDAELAAAARAVIVGVVGREVPSTPNACRNEIGLDTDGVEP